MRSRFIGGLLLIIGTSIGGGMLALPIANAALGFWPSSLYLIFCWLLMTLGAFFILEVNLYLPAGKNMVSMAQLSLGPWGLLLTWLSYLLLLYTLLCAYISGGADVLGSILAYWQWSAHPSICTLVFTLSFGLFAYAGTRQVDLCNRLLMLAKMTIFIFLLLLIGPAIKAEALFKLGPHPFARSSLMILITSFGFAIIVPNLREYFQEDLTALKRVIGLGSLVPLCCYLAWDAVVMGLVPMQDLQKLMQSPHASSALAELVSQYSQNTLISMLFHGFVSICMLTAFLGVSLCLISFLADGLKFTTNGLQGLGLFILSFLPPILTVLYYPGAYLAALEYAGALCVILLLLLPSLMSFFGRKRYQGAFIVPGGLFTQALVFCSSVCLLLYA